MPNPVSGFSKLSKDEKIQWLVSHYFNNRTDALVTLKSYWNTNLKLQELHDEFIENTITNYYLPFGIAPNFLINDRLYTIPMAIEESSVVAAASNAAKFWLDRGGFKAQVISTVKTGQVHFNYYGDAAKLETFFKSIKPKLLASVDEISKNMQARGGGVLDIVLINKTKDLDHYYQLHCSFETVDAMGANYINSCLEQFAQTLEREAKHYAAFSETEKRLEIVMSILSNYVPECLVKASVSCYLEALSTPEFNGEEFAQKFIRALEIAQVEPRRAVTHNKGIMNGIDAVILATGNDFRAVEAGIHAYASKTGHYTSLSHAQIKDGVFNFWIEIPLALGTVGGLTKLHPLVQLAFNMLRNPNAKKLMQIVAVAGLAQNFAAIKSLVTTGIQRGHMKMHLMNILNQLNASKQEKELAITYFKTHKVSHREAVNFIENLRK